MKRIELESNTILLGISAASGIEVIDDRIYTIGDDSSAIYILESSTRELIAICPLIGEENQHFIKATKPDFECLTSILWDNEIYLLVAGSGSVRERRDKAILWNIRTQEREIISLTVLYDAFSQLDEIGGRSELNIEGLISTDEDLLWMQRGNNFSENGFFSMRIDSFMKFIESGRIPTIKFNTVLLPNKHNHKIGLSGGCFHFASKKLICCASIENTPNNYDDGQILGSFVFVIDELNCSILKSYSIPVNKDGIFMKLESVAFLNEDEFGGTMAGVCDPDGGDSSLIIFPISI